VASLKRNFFYNILLSTTQVIFPLFVFPYLARVIHPEGIGIVSFVDSFCRYMILFSALGIPIYGVREIAKAKNDKIQQAKIFKELVFLHVIVTFLFLLIYFGIIFSVGKFQNYTKYYIAGSLMIFSNVFIVEWYFQGIEDFRFITLRNIIVRSFLLFFVYLFVKSEEDSFIYFLITVIMSVLNAAINFFYAIRKIDSNYHIEINNLKKHVKPLLYIFSSIAFISIYTLLDTILLGFLADDRSVGIYSMALKVARVPMMFIGAFGVVLIPKLSAYFIENKMVVFESLIQKSFNLVVTFAIPIIFLIITCSREIILIFAGNYFIESQFVLNILSLLGLLIGISNIFGLQVLTPMGKDKYLTISVFFGTLVSLGLNFFLIPLYKEKGAAISNILAELTVMLSTILFSKKFINIKIDFKLMTNIIFCSIPIIIIHTLVKSYFNSLFLILFLTTFISFLYYLFAQIYFIKNSIIIEIKEKIYTFYERI